MLHLALRYLLVIVVSIILSLLGLTGNVTAVQTLFTVLGISFSISMSLIISFDLSQVHNEIYRKPIRLSIKQVRNELILDFFISVFILLLSSLEIVSDWIICIKGTTILDFQTFAICAIFVSIIYEAYNFKRIHNLHDELAEAIVKEK